MPIRSYPVSYSYSPFLSAFAKRCLYFQVISIRGARHLLTLFGTELALLDDRRFWLIPEEEVVVALEIAQCVSRGYGSVLEYEISDGELDRVRGKGEAGHRDGGPARLVCRLRDCIARL